MAPPDESGNTPATLTFDSVTSPGIDALTRLDIDDAQTPAPAGFSLLTDPPQIYEITTTAGFEGSITVCFTVGAAGATGTERLYHYGERRLAGHYDVEYQRRCVRPHEFLLALRRRPALISVRGVPAAGGQRQHPERDEGRGGGANKVQRGRRPGARHPGAGLHHHALAQIACSGGAALDAIEQTVAAGGSALSYPFLAASQYTYVWKTQKLWAGTCRQFVFTLADGTSHSALFDFRK